MREGGGSDVDEGEEERERARLMIALRDQPVSTATARDDITKCFPSRYVCGNSLIPFSKLINCIIMHCLKFFFFCSLPHGETDEVDKNKLYNRVLSGSQAGLRPTGPGVDVSRLQGK